MLSLKLVLWHNYSATDSLNMCCVDWVMTFSADTILAYDRQIFRHRATTYAMLA